MSIFSPPRDNSSSEPTDLGILQSRFSPLGSSNRGLMVVPVLVLSFTFALKYTIHLKITPSDSAPSTTLGVGILLPGFSLCKPTARIVPIGGRKLRISNTVICLTSLRSLRGLLPRQAYKSPASPLTFWSTARSILPRDYLSVVTGTNKLVSGKSRTKDFYSLFRKKSSELSRLAPSTVIFLQHDRSHI